MSNSQSSDSTLQDDSGICSTSTTNLGLSSLPAIFVLPTNLAEHELHEAEDMLVEHGALLTYNITEANIVLGNIFKERRARFELKCGKVRTEELNKAEEHVKPAYLDAPLAGNPAAKRRRLNNGQQSPANRSAYANGDDAGATTDETTDSSSDNETDTAMKPTSQLSIANKSASPNDSTPDLAEATESFLHPINRDDLESKVKVIRLEWLHRSLAAKKLQPFEPYLIYEARLLSPEDSINSKEPTQVIRTADSSALRVDEQPRASKELCNGLMKRAKADAEADMRPLISRARKRDHARIAANKDFDGRSFASSAQATNQVSRGSLTRPSQLQHQTTSEHEEDFASSPRTMPDWVREKKIYSCERATPFHSPNEKFIEQLKKIKMARILTGDQIGVRAYSTSIASIAAYPYPFQSSQEILSLPGCDHKIAHIFHEWQRSNGQIQAVADIDADEVLQVLRLFYEIWGVGASTAREFYYNRKWRDLDDIVEQGWQSLTRAQQIGVKYYDEFQLKIPRAEVESIVATIAAHARRLTDSSLEAIIVGGHRRGQTESGDVDVILTHRTESVTLNLVEAVVESLEASGYITHVLTQALTNSHRSQQTLPLHSLHGPAGHGFDSLDKAFIVWQDPVRLTGSDPDKNDPHPHRRVDIIVSPWRTIGCAIAGWTSGTTFQRDLRRFAKRFKGWKFDSSGVRDRGSGEWIDLEGYANEKTRCASWEEAEKRVFEGMGLEWREPEERCTG
ncbi:hypothetical protein MMC07_004112 [Pseudocyphellaria aurata]|nr:hypothetical protein [Pseudocyphellaria aurata]